LVYATLVMVKSRGNAIVTDRNWADAYFLKGFALIDANRPDEAITWFDKALTLSPNNAHMLAERAEWYKARHEWDRAYQEFDAARGATDFSEDDVFKAEKGRALRGMAFVRVEQNRLDEAEKLIRQALDVDPTDQKALSELQYIQSRR
jgi:tetratricopeptide (TPR) repeat protein